MNRLRFLVFLDLNIRNYEVGNNNAFTQQRPMADPAKRRPSGTSQPPRPKGRGL